MRTIAGVVCFVCAFLMASPDAKAQPRFSIAVNGGYQPTTTDFDDSFTFDLYQETGTTDVEYPIDAGALFDVGGGVRIWRGLGVGVSVSRFVRDGVVSSTTALPHPFFFGQPREVTGNAGGIDREETGVHVHAQYFLPMWRRLQVVLMAGPSFMQINQGIVTAVNYTEEYPYDTATFSRADSRIVDGSATGFNAGADVQWMFTDAVGAGLLVRVTRATVEIEPRANTTLSVDAGGAQVGAGIRFRF